MDAAGIFIEESKRAGFHRIGFAPVDPWPRHALYRRWLRAGYAGEMDYLERDAAPRRDPRALLASARTIVVVALAHTPDAVDAADREPRGVIARYARGPDYHMVMKPLLRRLGERVASRLHRSLAIRICVDTAPLAERDAAARAGVGFVGKNTMAIAAGLGSYVLLGELLTDLAITPSESAAPRCGECRACLDACPTGAFTDAYTLDARRCISYLTIEARGAMPRELRQAVGDRIFGCDVCQEVCPFNASAPAGSPLLGPLPRLEAPRLVELLGLGAARYRKFVKRTALRRISRPQLLRNVAVALGNVGGPDELPALMRALDEPSPLVRQHVAWAIGEIGARHPGTAR